MIYDLFYVSTGSIDDTDWKIFKQRFPMAQRVDNAVSINDITKRAFTKMFWVVWNDLNVKENFNFEYRATQWDLEYIHVFKNYDYYDGVCLFPKNATISQREFKHRFFIHKKEIDIEASTTKPYDIVFISYNESNAEENYNKLISRFPNAKRIHNIKGIHQAHIEAAKIVNTDMFWVVDGDAVIDDTFNFDHSVAAWDRDTVHVWRSSNPINKLEYGYGGVKLLPTAMTINMDLNKTDMTTGISSKFKAMEQVSNLTVFNTDPFNSWKSAFRECCKLASRVIDRQQDLETQERLDAWCTLQEDAPYGFHAYAGAMAGRKYGEDNKENKEALKKINDFAWLNDEYRRTKV